MRTGRMKLSLLPMLLVAVANGNRCFHEDRTFQRGTPRNPGYHPTDTGYKELREYTVRGKRVKAYSKKDAVKRLEHRGNL